MRASSHGWRRARLSPGPCACHGWPRDGPHLSGAGLLSCRHADGPRFALLGHCRGRTRPSRDTRGPVSGRLLNIPVNHALGSRASAESRGRPLWRTRLQGCMGSGSVGLAAAHRQIGRGGPTPCTPRIASPEALFSALSLAMPAASHCVNRCCHFGPGVDVGWRVGQQNRTLRVMRFPPRAAVSAHVRRAGAGPTWGSYRCAVFPAACLPYRRPLRAPPPTQSAIAN